MNLCRGELTTSKNAPKCPRRTECVHYRAMLDWMTSQVDFAPDLGADMTITHRLCQTTEYERYVRREGVA